MRLGTRIALWKIRWETRKSDKVLNRLARQSGKKLGDCTCEQWYSDCMMDQICLEARERKAISDDLGDQAQRLYLPTPSLNDKTKWDSDYAVHEPTRFLTPEAMTELRSSIRKERAERRAVFEWWLKLIGGLVGIVTGLVGALIGLVAIWRK
jgi:hypothetical protein